MSTTKNKTAAAAAKTVKMVAARWEKANAASLAFVRGEVRAAMLWVQIAGPRMVGIEASKPGFNEWIAELSSAFCEYTTTTDFYAD